MHVKHRNGPGSLYRSNSIGIRGVAAANRVSPEGSARGPRMYSSEYRNYSRDGYGRGGRSRNFQQTSPPQEADIMVEAGKLAAEYLVAKGVLPPNALSGKWQKDGSKNQAGSSQEFRQHQGDRTQTPINGRASVHSRLGNALINSGPGRRRDPDEYYSLDSRYSIRERKRTGSSKYYGTDASRESGSSESVADKSGTSPGKEANGDTSTGHNPELLINKDGNCGVESLSTCELTQTFASKTCTDPAAEQSSSAEEDVTYVNDITLSNEKHLTSDTREPLKRSDGAGTEVVEERRNDDNNNNNLDRKDEKNKDVVLSLQEDTIEGHLDLAKHCKFVNVRTKTRSSLTNKGPKIDLVPMQEDLSLSKNDVSEGSDIHLLEDNTGNSGVIASSQGGPEIKCLQLDMSNAPPMEKEQDVSEKTSPSLCLRSDSSIELPQSTGQEPTEKLSEFQSSNSMFMERGEKRVMDCDSDSREDFKKIRQWLPSLDAQSDHPLVLPSSMEEQPSIQEPRTSQSAHVTLSPDEKSLDSVLFARNHSDASQFMEEKQLFPGGSFKICDLNLVGTSDVIENHDTDPMLVFPSVPQAGKVRTPIGVDLSMSNNTSNNNDKEGIEGNGVEVIDLDSDSAPEHKTFSHPERRGDAVFTDLDGFPSNVHNANVIPDVQDGYGLMISELLANGSPNCSSVPSDMNSLNNHMGLPNNEAMLGDDDSIYMSLGEIPISLLGPWEQPPQDYGKPF